MSDLNFFLHNKIHSIIILLKQFLQNFEHFIILLQFEAKNIMKNFSIGKLFIQHTKSILNL